MKRYRVTGLVKAIVEAGDACEAGKKFQNSDVESYEEAYVEEIEQIENRDHKCHGSVEASALIELTDQNQWMLSLSRCWLN